MSISEEKRALRREMRARVARATAPPFDRRAAAVGLYARLARLPEICAPRSIAAYVDFEAEAPTKALIETLFFEFPRRMIAVPFCEGAEMFFYRLTPPDMAAERNLELTSRTFEERFPELAPGVFGILEPTPEARRAAERILPPDAFDVVLVPGLAFDGEGRRLGRGAGYYDRFLAKTRPDALKIGIALDEQIIERVPTDVFDVRMDCVATPTRILAPPL
ncbi:MAG: 5-formyltetrahydrofolate cyclo-ligase [Thermoguttaceae bacterium]|nr:5-formyltetrahydrofolate cyclo-ligase [Thermoguttaceae bacterium]